MSVTWSRWVLVAAASVIGIGALFLELEPERIDGAVYVDDVSHADSADVAVHAILADSALAAPGGGGIADGSIVYDDFGSTLKTTLRNTRPDTLRGPIVFARGTSGLTAGVGEGFSSGAGGGYTLSETLDSTISTSVIFPFSVGSGRTTVRITLVMTCATAATSGQEWDLEVGGGGCNPSESWFVVTTQTRSFVQSPTSQYFPTVLQYTFSTSALGVSSTAIGMNVYAKRYGTTATGGTGNNGDDAPGVTIILGQGYYEIW